MQAGPGLWVEAGGVTTSRSWGDLSVAYVGRTCVVRARVSELRSSSSPFVCGGRDVAWPWVFLLPTDRG